MSIEIQNTKIDLIQWLATIENMDILQKIKSIKEIELNADSMSFS